MSTAEIEVVEAFRSIRVTPEKAMASAAALNKRDALEFDILKLTHSLSF
jgi:hypothetical protein